MGLHAVLGEAYHSSRFELLRRLPIGGEDSSAGCEALAQSEQTPL